MTAARVPPRLLAVLLTVAACSWTAAVVVSALAHTAAPTIAHIVDLVGSLVCHQREERSFHLFGQQLAVCGRCTGLYLSGTLGAMLAWLGRARLPRNSRALLIAAAAPTAITLVIEWFGLANPGNVLRSAAALPLGGVAGWLFVQLLRVEEQPGRCAIIT
jgi:uncharacterized membrane protein